MRLSERITGRDFWCWRRPSPLSTGGAISPDGDVMVLQDRWYTAFQIQFPRGRWMDGAVRRRRGHSGLFSGKAWGARAGLMAASAILYLAAMDITFDVENHMPAMATRQTTR